MFIHPSAGSPPLTTEDLHARLKREGINADFEVDDDLAWLSIDDNSDLRCIVEGNLVTSAVLEGVPDDPEVFGAIERVFDAIGWELAGEDEAMDDE